MYTYRHAHTHVHACMSYIIVFADCQCRRHWGNGITCEDRTPRPPRCYRACPPGMLYSKRRKICLHVQNCSPRGYWCEHHALTQAKNSQQHTMSCIHKADAAIVSYIMFTTWSYLPCLYVYNYVAYAGYCIASGMCYRLNFPSKVYNSEYI